MAAAAAAAAAADVVDDKDDSSSSSGPLPSVPITETPNELTENIDVVDAVGLVRLLRGADAQIFSGYQHHPGLFDARVLRAAEQVVSATTRLLRLLTSPAPATGATAPPPRPIVVMTGCGTSGRIAYFVARAFNRTLRALLPSTATAPVFHYLVSGGDTALLESEELPEDDPVTGAKELADLVTRTRATHLLCVGITCGLSAPYVAGQLDWCMAQQQQAGSKSATAAGGASTLQEVTTVLMGFNPLALARRAPIELWHGGRTFYDVAHQLASRSQNDGQHHIVLNPVVGPEPVTGSSRMKGGSVTKLLLESVFSGALWHVFGPDAPGPYGAQVSLAVPRALGAGAGPGAGVLVDLLTSFESSALRHTYLCGDALSRIVSLASDSLRHDSTPDSSSSATSGTNTGHLYYLGEGDGAVMAFIDASEMPDTYGTPHTDVRAFVCGGWSAMANARGDLSHHNPLFRIGPQHFVSDVLPRVTARDTVVVVTDQQRTDIHVELRRLAALAQAKGAKVALVAVTAATASAGAAVAAAEATGSNHGASVVGHKRPHSSIGPSAPRQFKEQKDHGGAAASAPAAAAAAPDDGHRLKKHKTDLYWPPTRADSTAAAAAAASAAGTASAASASSTAGATAAASDVNTVSTTDGTDVVFDAVCHIELPYSGLLRDSTGGNSGGVGDRFRCHALTAQATKWVLNAITTGAHVRNGSVLRNRMINMTVANNKLYHRAVRIVVDSVRAVVGVGPAVSLTDSDAERCLLRAIHSVDVVDGTLMAQRTSQHIVTATKVANVIPVAILLASGDARFATVAQARAALRTQANVRLLLRGAAAK